MNKQILDILIKNNILTPEKAEEAEINAFKSSKPVEQVLLDLKLVTSEDIARAKSEQFDIPFINLREVTVPNEVFSLLDNELIKAHKAVPFELTDSEIKIAMVDPFDIPAIQAIKQSIRTTKPLKIYISTPELVSEQIEQRATGAIGAEVSQALESVEQPVTEISDAVDDLEASALSLQTAPVARIVNSILQFGARIEASDIHIEPTEKDVRVRYRINGVMVEKLRLPKSVHPAVIARIKIMSNLKIDEKRVPQDGRLQIKVDNRKFDLRVSVMPSIHGEKIVLRLLERYDAPPPIETSGLRGPGYKRFLDALQVTTGIILVTGPTGSGKTRTLAGALGRLNTPDVNIITLEDPVEIRIPGVTQIQVNADVGLTFASGLRSILRQDPDIIMVGEIRDAETASLAVQAALTGHRVLATLHTNSAAAALPRLVDMHVEPYLLASVLRLSVAQRLARRICDNCKEAYPATPEEIELINKQMGSMKGFDLVNYMKSRCTSPISVPGGGEITVPCPVDKGNGQTEIFLHRGRGCERCDFTGYEGRVGIFEVMDITDKMGQLIMQNQSSQVINKEAVDNGMITLMQDGFMKALDGITTIEEIFRINRE